MGRPTDRVCTEETVHQLRNNFQIVRCTMYQIIFNHILPKNFPKHEQESDASLFLGQIQCEKRSYHFLCAQENTRFYSPVLKLHHCQMKKFFECQLYSVNVLSHNDCSLASTLANNAVAKNPELDPIYIFARTDNLPTMSNTAAGDKMLFTLNQEVMARYL